jgi:hypothetical protein
MHNIFNPRDTDCGSVAIAFYNPNQKLTLNTKTALTA